VRRKREQLRSGAKENPRRVGVDHLRSLPAAQPAFVPTMQCKLVDRLAVGGQWRYELKLDGYRAEAEQAAKSQNQFTKSSYGECSFMAKGFHW
jgi:ATP-dependent DNA ligase